VFVAVKLTNQERLSKETLMSHRNGNRYANLSDQALLKVLGRVSNTRRRGQINSVLTRRGAK
jgi:hypothetical protein